MKKKVYGRKLSRERDTRRALFRSLTKALVLHGSIKTTKAKAKAVQPQVERLVTLAKKGGLAQRRKVYSATGNDRVTTDTLFNLVAPVFSKTQGGYTRIIPLPDRLGDYAKMVRLEWSKEVKVAEQKDEKKRKVKKTEEKKTSGEKASMRKK